MDEFYDMLEKANEIINSWLEKLNDVEEIIKSYENI